MNKAQISKPQKARKTTARVCDRIRAAIGEITKAGLIPVVEMEGDRVTITAEQPGQSTKSEGAALDEQMKAAFKKKECPA